MKAVPATAAMIILAASAFLFGVHVGGNVLYGEIAPYRAVASSAALIALKSAMPQDAQHILEMDLDNQIYSHATMSNRYLSWVFPELNEAARDSAMRSVAEYRQAHPFSLANEVEIELSQSKVEFFSARQEVIDAELRKYISPPHNNSLQARRP